MTRPPARREDSMYSLHNTLLLVGTFMIACTMGASTARSTPDHDEHREVFVTLDLLGCDPTDARGELSVTADVARGKRSVRHRDVWSGDAQSSDTDALTHLFVWNGTLATGEKAMIEIGIESDAGRSVRTMLLTASIRGVKDYITSKVPGYLAGAVSDGLSSLFSFWRPEPSPERPSSFMLVIENTGTGIEARLHPRHRSNLVDDRLQIQNGGAQWLGVPRVNGTAVGSTPCACNPSPRLVAAAADP
jgi:hypothetical protein